jgi:hypothetical protein
MREEAASQAASSFQAGDSDAVTSLTLKCEEAFSRLAKRGDIRDEEIITNEEDIGAAVLPTE